MGEPAFCLREIKGANQLRSNPTADRCLYFRYMDSTIPLFVKSETSIFKHRVVFSGGNSPVCVKPRIRVFS